MASATSTSRIAVFGIRHHGPGCARALRAALEAMAPDVVLVEGPPDAHEVLPLILDEEMQPPVALLIYRPDAPQQAAFYPFAVFSPEWQALRFALERKLPARFIDLPQMNQLAMRAEEEKAKAAGSGDSGRDSREGGCEIGISHQQQGSHQQEGSHQRTSEQAAYEDPLAILAEAAGYTDHELWWEHQIEQRRDAVELFQGIFEAMKTLRAEVAGGPLPPHRADEPRREAHMRQAIRAAIKEGFTNIAVVCGAWHAPALQDVGPAKPDAELLRGLPKVKVTATWIPWTNSRLSFRSGYGAGVTSPGWYEHLWQTPDRAAIQWAARAARLLREDELDASAAGVIEAVRTAEALAAIRGRPLPGLAELNDAVQAVLCHGEITPMLLIHERLVIGDRLGSVPEATPTVPLQRDLEAQQKSLRLKPTTEIKLLDLDLREATDLGRSRLLHRLRLMGIPWGQHKSVHGKAGTFHELWELKWDPEFAVNVVEAGVWGRTIVEAASGSACHAADEAAELADLTKLLDAAVLADLAGAIDYVLGKVQSQAAIATDVRHLMEALPPLARVARYGDVRQTRTEQLLPIIHGLFERILVGLPLACGAIDDEAAGQIVEGIGGVQNALDLLDDREAVGEWQEMLRGLLAHDAVHALVRGWSCRLLLEKGQIPTEELYRLARLALAHAVPVPQAAAWIQGLLRGSGMLVLQLDGIWTALDTWLRELSEEAFVETLPLIRRAFSGFAPAERRAMGEKVRLLGEGAVRRGPATAEADEVDQVRAASVLPILAHVLGVSADGLV